MKKLNLKTLFLLMCLIMSLDMTAEHMTAEQARSAAQQFLRLKVAKGSSIKSLATRQVMPYSPVSDQRAAVYAVNLGSNDGFVLVGGNSQSQEVIGYCDNGSFNAEEMPANMRSWLESYICSASQVKDTKQARGLRSSGHYPTKTPIAPLLHCKWNQLKPYNNDCLVIDGSAFVPGTAVSPFQAYFMPIGSVTAAPTLNINVDYGSSTGINEIYTSEPNDRQGPIYNLNGQRVTRPGNGIYIMGGKKFKLIKF